MPLAGDKETRMGNTCNCICRQIDEDEAANALLNGLDYPTSAPPRGPPPPYQVSHNPATYLAPINTNENKLPWGWPPDEVLKSGAVIL